MNMVHTQRSTNSTSRRELLYACAVGMPYLAPGLRELLNSQSYMTGRTIMTAPVNIPASFAGMHFHKWPQGDPASPAPVYGYGTVRSHDYGIAWNNIQTAPGRYAWERMDAWVQAHAGTQKTLIYTLYGTPAWASSKPATKDAYGHYGAGAPPNTMQTLSEFVTAVIRRYNTPVNHTIGYLEVWNEPHFVQNGRGFWWGSADELAEICRIAATAAKAADPVLKILSPGFDGLQAGPLKENAGGVEASLRDFLQARDSTGQKPGHLLDGIAIHTYNARISGPNDGLEGILLQVKATLAQAGLKLPVYTTESGYMHDASFTNASLEDKARQLRRQAAVQAALGVRCLCFYAHDDEFCGNPSRNSVVAAAINDIHTRLAGHRLEQVTVQASGAVNVKTTAESFTW